MPLAVKKKKSFRTRSHDKETRTVAADTGFIPFSSPFPATPNRQAVAKALETSSRATDDIVDSPKHHAGSNIGPMNEQLPSVPFAGASEFPSKNMPPTLRERSSSVSRLERQRALESSFDRSDTRPDHLRRLATASGASFPRLSHRGKAHHGPSQHVHVEMHPNTPPAQGSDQELYQNSSFAGQSERKASSTSTSSRFTSSSDASPTTSVNNFGNDGSLAGPSEGITKGASVRKTSGTSSKVASSWMAPDSWAVQPDISRENLKSAESGIVDDEATISDKNSPRLKRFVASRASLAANMNSSSGSQSSKRHFGHSTVDALYFDGGLHGKREANEKPPSASFEREGRPAKSFDSSFETIHSSSQPPSGVVSNPRPNSRGGAIGTAAAAAAGMLGFHRPSKMKIASRPNTGGNTANAQPNHKAVPSTPITEDDLASLSWRLAKRPQPNQSYSKNTFLRIYKNDNTHTVVSASMSTTAAELQATVARKVNDPTTACRLFVCDKGSERLLDGSERPAMLQRRRLLQAGYTEGDSLDELGREDLSYLLKFVYRPDRAPHFHSDSFGNTEDDFSVLDLHKQNLEMIPVFLYHRAEWIKSLDVSANPMRTIPHDFLQLCTNLTTLCLSRLALKQIPESITDAPHLTHLDVSDNRIAELDHIDLSKVTHLVSLRVQNNHMSQLPSYFSSMQFLKDLIVSNNRFEVFPEVACDLQSLLQLDISFNTIAELPKRINNLQNLQRLVLVGNSLEVLPDEIASLHQLQVIDLRRNLLHDIKALFGLPKLESLLCEHNSIKHLDVTFGTRLRRLEIGQNPLSRTTFKAEDTCSLTKLDLSSSNISKLDDRMLTMLPSLEELILDRNKLAVLPETISRLKHLRRLSCTANLLAMLPDTIGQLTNLVDLKLYSNNLRSLPASLWQCASLQSINISSNLLETFPLPQMTLLQATETSSAANTNIPAASESRKGSASSLGAAVLPSGARLLPPLGISLVRLILADNRLTEDVFEPISQMAELEVLNLSGNDLYDIPNYGLSKLGKLRELYLSSNSLRSIPADELSLLHELRVLYLNGNKLVTLPAEIGELYQLVKVDVSNNKLKYNISNQQYDWNWNSNTKLRFLNLSGNSRLNIKNHSVSDGGVDSIGRVRTDIPAFQRLNDLRLLGLMDVTLINCQNPDEYEDRRVRTSLSHINQMSYGISDSLGCHDHLSIHDVVIQNFRKMENECLFGFFAGKGHGERIGSRISFHLAQWIGFRIQSEVQSFQNKDHLTSPNLDKVPDVIRRAFLRMQKDYADLLLSGSIAKRNQALMLARRDERKADAPSIAESIATADWQSGASALLAYVIDRTLFIANVGDSQAVLSRNSTAVPISKKHEPLDREETLRIRSAEGWVSLNGRVNDTLDVSRGFGYFHLTPIVNAAPAVTRIDLTDSDEFVILANDSLWKYMSHQTAVDIARMTRDQPMRAAQQLRDFAIGYGAEDSIMVMVVSVENLFNQDDMRMKYPRNFMDGVSAPGSTLHFSTSGLEPQLDGFRLPSSRRGREGLPGDRTIARLTDEVNPPIDEVALVFSDIRNSTSLWETKDSMHNALRTHNLLLRRCLRNNGGYEVKTEGDAFMVSFDSVTSALYFCFQVQIGLLKEAWPQEILDSEDGKEIFDEQTGELLYRGLSVRMGVHWGRPVCEKDPITNRMDYFGPVVNRASRISGAAEGGQILVSRDVILKLRSIIAAFDDQANRVITQGQENMDMERGQRDGPEGFPVLRQKETRDVILLRRLGFAVSEIGERKLKGLETPESLHLVYPNCLSGRFVNVLQQISINPGRDEAKDHILGIPQPLQLDAAVSPAKVNPPVEVFESPNNLLDVDRIRLLGYLCIRLEAVAHGGVLPEVVEAIRSEGGTHRLSSASDIPASASIRTSLLTVASPRQAAVAEHLMVETDAVMCSIREDATDEELVDVLRQIIHRLRTALFILKVRRIASRETNQQPDLAIDLMAVADMLCADRSA